jgi:FKBP-type peptidyl-prolyl cis-trans isomerase
MKRIAMMTVPVGLLIASCSGGSHNIELKTDDQKFSYMIGQQIGNNLKQQGLSVDADVLAASLQDALKGSPSKLSMDEMQQIGMRMQQKMMAKQMGESKENKDKGEKFLEQNKKKPGVQTTADGLQYQILKPGAGVSPKATDSVTVNYRGTLIDGTEFDSSYKRGEPAKFPVNGVIRGWTEALLLMKPGAKFKLWIPAPLAYGERGQPGIPAESALIFEVELVKVN